MSSFENLRIVDNFYQTSLFFPMPTIIISTLTEEGTTSLGPYSLVQPYYVAGKDYYAMLLCCRNSSNTAQHILRAEMQVPPGKEPARGRDRRKAPRSALRRDRSH